MKDRKLIIGDRLKALRGRRSRETVAHDLGVTPQAVWLWESGQRVPGDGMKVKIAEYYRKSVGSIFYKSAPRHQAEDEEDFFAEM